MKRQSFGKGKRGLAALKDATDTNAIRKQLRRAGFPTHKEWIAGSFVWVCEGQTFKTLDEVREYARKEMVIARECTGGIRQAGDESRGEQEEGGGGAQTCLLPDVWPYVGEVVGRKQGPAAGRTGSNREDFK